LSDDLLAPYVTNLDRPVFALRNLPEEVLAVLFAYYSRSSQSLRANLCTLLAAGDLDLVGGRALADDDDALADARERARCFHEKWVVGYGHGSVAEHAVVHLAVEDVSIVASKAIEDNRLASYTEKSTRYVAFAPESFVREPTIAESGDVALYDETCRLALATYARLLPQIEEQVRADFAPPADWAPRRYDSVCRAQACDVARYLLPAATRTNLGLTINGRALEHMLTKLFSSELRELRTLAAAMRREAEHIVPTLIKYADPNPYLRATPRRVRELAADLLPSSPPVAEANGARLLAGPAEPLVDLATAILYEARHEPFAGVRAQVAALSAAQRSAVIAAYLDGRGRFDAPLRALEHLTYTFEVLVDYGAYRDIQRHRLCTQTSQVLDTSAGYETPPEIAALGHGPAYHTVMARSFDAHAALTARHGEEAAQYVLPLAWRKRVLFTWNLRELHHFIALRSGRQGHPSYRHIAQDCWRELERVCPELAAGVRVDLAARELARG